MVWQIAHNVNVESAKTIPLQNRSPFLEFAGLMSQEFIEETRATGSSAKIIELERRQNLIKFAASAPSPRVIKSHLPLEFLPPKLLDTCKVIFVCRNPKDVCVSYFHHSKRFGMECDFEAYANLFLQGAVMHGSYWNMLKVCNKIPFQIPV